MTVEEKNMRTFFTQVADSFSENGFKPVEFEISEKELINNKECFFIFNLSKNKIVYHSGFKKLLGFQNNDYDINFVLKNYHPDDVETVNRITKATLLHCLSLPYHCLDSTLQMTFRVKNNEGTYTKVLSQSTVFQMNEQGVMTHAFVKLTNIDFLESPCCVNWYFHAKNLNLDDFRDQIYSAYYDFFTKREKEIIIEIVNGLTNYKIAEKLNISKHTVSSHRKSILKKSGKHNTKDLILFCKRKGIL